MNYLLTLPQPFSPFDKDMSQEEGTSCSFLVPPCLGPPTKRFLSFPVGKMVILVYYQGCSGVSLLLLD